MSTTNKAVQLNIKNPTTGGFVADGATVSVYSLSNTATPLVSAIITNGAITIPAGILTVGLEYEIHFTVASQFFLGYFVCQVPVSLALVATNIPQVASATFIATGTAFPTNLTPQAGQMFYRTDTKIMSVYDAVAGHWISLRDGTNQT